MQTKTKKNGRTKKATPDLLTSFGKRGPGRPKKPGPTASEIADSLEARAKELQEAADILRGSA
jgi:hypothetical protein